MAVIVDIGTWNELGLFGVGEVDSVARAERVSRSAAVLLAWTVLKVVLSWAWHVLFDILINRVCFGVHADFGSFSDS